MAPLGPWSQFNSVGRLRRRDTETLDGIEVRGSTAFRARTREALEMLRSSPCFRAVRKHILVIRQGRRSGMKAWAAKPTFTVGTATWRHSAIWYASAIAHDCYHAKLYCDATKGNGARAPDNGEWTGVDAERKCLAFQARVLLELDAEEKFIAYVGRCAQNPTYQGRAVGWSGWLDYLRRWW